MSLLVVKHKDFKRVVSSPYLASTESTTGKPKSHTFEYGKGGLHDKTPKSYKAAWHSGSRDGTNNSQTMAL